MKQNVTVVTVVLSYNLSLTKYGEAYGVVFAYEHVLLRIRKVYEVTTMLMLLNIAPHTHKNNKN